MRTFAYCIPAAARAVRRATGVEPLTSPPMRQGTLAADPSGCTLLYFRLHGMEQAPGAMFGDGMIPALSVEQVAEWNLAGAVVVLANCYGATSQFPAAFYRAGAVAVIAGDGPNQAASARIIGADLLAMWVRKVLTLLDGAPMSNAIVRWAMIVARARLALTAWRAPDRDAMAFRIVDKGGFDEREGI
jgi:hypothetical protein